MEEIEIWLPFPEYEGHYEISNMGRVRSLKYNRITLMSPRKGVKGYIYASVTLKNINKKKFVHRAVAIAFIPNPNNHPEVNHLDSNRGNNKVTNLSWCTHQENVRYSWDTNGRVGPDKGKFGKDNKDSKKVIQYDLKMNFIREWDSLADIERELKFSKSNVWSCCKGKYDSAYGFIWKYKEVPCQ